MQLGILINDKEYRDALIERLLSYDNDLLVKIINGRDTFSKDGLILTDVNPNALNKSQLSKLCHRTLFLSSSFDFSEKNKGCHCFFKYSGVDDLLSELALIYKEWRGIGYGRNHSTKIISVCFENDASSYTKCMSLARQLIYRRGCKILVLGLGYINDYGLEDIGKSNVFARLMYSISTGRKDAAYGYTYTDTYGISALMLNNGKNPLAYLEADELMSIIDALSVMFDTLILDIGSCYSSQNLMVADQSDNIVYFENGRRNIDIESMFGEKIQERVIKIRCSSETEEAVAIDDVINRIYGTDGDESFTE